MNEEDSERDRATRRRRRRKRKERQEGLKVSEFHLNWMKMNNNQVND